MKSGFVFATILTAGVLATPMQAAEIDACKYLVVADLARDPYAIAAELRSQGRTRGFIVVDSASEIPPAESFKACVMIADWLGDTTSGELALQVRDGASRTPVALLRVAALNWWGLERTVRGGVTRLFDQLQYTGFKEEAYKVRMDRLYPPRPKLAVTEAEIAARPAEGIEGIWTDREEQYRL